MQQWGCSGSGCRGGGAAARGCLRGPDTLLCRQARGLRNSPGTQRGVITGPAGQRLGCTCMCSAHVRAGKCRRAGMQQCAGAAVQVLPPELATAARQNSRTAHNDSTQLLCSPESRGTHCFSAPSRCSASATAAAIASSACCRFLLGAAAAACAAASGPGSTRWHRRSTSSLACPSPAGAACSPASTSPTADCAARRTLARPSRLRLP